MRAYWDIIRNTFVEQLTYTRNFITGIALSALALLLRILVWMGLYDSIGNGTMMGRSLEDMITYSVIASLVTTVTSGGNVAGMLEGKMKSGEIALDYLRPASPKLMMVAGTWGGKLLEIIRNIIPILLCVLILGGIQTPQRIEQVFIFILAVVMGYMVNLMFEFLMGSFAFWFVPVGILSWFVSFFSTAMSGAFVPLWLLPDWLRAIAGALPFQAVVYAPVSVYMGQADMADIGLTLLVQLGWIAGLWTLQHILWRKGLHKIVVFGG